MKVFEERQILRLYKLTDGNRCEGRVLNQSAFSGNRNKFFFLVSSIYLLSK